MQSEWPVKHKRYVLRSFTFRRGIVTFFVFDSGDREIRAHAHDCLARGSLGLRFALHDTLRTFFLASAVLPYAFTSPLLRVAPLVRMRAACEPHAAR